MEITPCYLDIGEEVGKGAVGIVYRAYDLNIDSGEPLVLKRLGNTKLLDVGEFDILFRFRHPNLLYGLRLYLPPTGDSCFTQNQAGVILPAMEKSGSNYMYEESSLIQRLEVFKQICEGLRFLHSNRVCHFDLKLPNVLLKDGIDKEHVMIGDFGLSRLMGSRRSFVSERLLVTISARPPENLSGSREFGYHTDIWSLGTVGLNLFIGERLSENPGFLIGILADYCRVFNVQIGDDGQWTKDLVVVLSSNRRYAKILKEYGLDVLIRQEGHRSPWYDPEERRQTILEIVQDDLLADIIASMLDMNPLSRPTIDEICATLEITPVQGEVILPIIPLLPVKTQILLRDILMELHFDAFSYKGYHLSLETLLLAQKLQTRCNPLILAKRQTIHLSSLVCLWIAAKMFGYPRYISEMLSFTRRIDPWDISLLTDDKEWFLRPWEQGQPLIPSSLLVMERLIVQGLEGVLG